MNQALGIAIVIIALYFFIINSIYLTILFLAIISINKNRRSSFSFNLSQMFKFRLLPPVSILLPAYNEEKTIVESIRSLLFVRYPQYELVVINDGSKDDTLEVLKESFKLKRTDFVFRKVINTECVRGIYISDSFKNLVVVNKDNGGKADALNAGINVSSYPYICAVDADTILGEDALTKLILPFIEDPEKTIAVGGVVKAANDCEINMGRLMKERIPKNLLVLLQSIEYARAFFMGRMGLASLNSLLIISGAFGMFKKEDMMKVQGYKKKSLGEDMMLVVKLHKLKRKEKKKYRIAFVPDTVCWTEIPSTLKVLKKQRIRWQMGLLESIIDNKEMFMNPRYGNIGLFAIPFYFLSEIIPPFLEIASYIAIPIGLYFHLLFPSYVLYFFITTWAYSICYSFIAIFMEQYSTATKGKFSHFILRFISSFAEFLFYRQVNLVYRIIAVFKFIGKTREWGDMERNGFKREPAR